MYKFILNKLAGASSTENLYSKWSRCGKRRRGHTITANKHRHRKHTGKNAGKKSLYRGTIEKGNRLWRQCWHWLFPCTITKTGPNERCGQRKANKICRRYRSCRRIVQCTTVSQREHWYRNKDQRDGQHNGLSDSDPIESTSRNASGTQSRYFGRRGFDKLRAWTSKPGSNSRTRPVIIPSLYWQRSDRSNHQSSSYRTKGGKHLFLNSEKFQNGHTNAKSTKNKSKYLEQFCMCGCGWEQNVFLKKCVLIFFRFFLFIFSHEFGFLWLYLLSPSS